MEPVRNVDILVRVVHPCSPAPPVSVPLSFIMNSVWRLVPRALTFITIHALIVHLTASVVKVKLYVLHVLPTTITTNQITAALRVVPQPTIPTSPTSVRSVCLHVWSVGVSMSVRIVWLVTCIRRDTVM